MSKVNILIMRMMIDLTIKNKKVMQGFLKKNMEEIRKIHEHK
jgi:hypothetical protein